MTFLANLVAILVAHSIQIAAIGAAASAIVSVEQVAVTTMELKDKIEPPNEETK